MGSNLIKGIGLAAAAIGAAASIGFALLLVRGDSAVWLVVTIALIEVVLAIAYGITLSTGRPKAAVAAAAVAVGLSVILPSSMIGVPAFVVAGVVALLLARGNEAAESAKGEAAAG